MDDYCEYAFKHEPDTVCEHCKLAVDSYGNTEQDFQIAVSLIVAVMAPEIALQRMVRVIAKKDNDLITKLDPNQK